MKIAPAFAGAFFSEVKRQRPSEVFSGAVGFVDF